MKSICKKTTCLLVFFLLTSLMTVASMQTVSVTTLDDYAPYTFKQENATIGNMETIPPGEDSNVLQGYSWDILRESFHSQGWTIELTVIPWARAMNNFDNGEVEVLFPTGKNNERLVIYN